MKNKKLKNYKKVYETIRQSDLFDRKFYLFEYEDVRYADVDPVRHYIEFGANEGRNPSTSFNTRFYLDNYPDVKENGINPLYHFIAYGGKEGRDPCAFFDARSYPKEHMERKSSKYTSFECAKNSITKKMVTPGEENKKPNLFQFRIDHCDYCSIKGWAVSLQDKGLIFDIKILIDGIEFASIKNDESRNDLERLGKSNGKGGFQFNFSPLLFQNEKHKVTILLPNGDKTSKVICPPNMQTREAYNLFPILPLNNKVTIIVPIYNAAEDLKVCIERLIAYTTCEARLIFVDDASTDERINQILKKYKQFQNITFLKNKINQGFTSTVNFGIAKSGRDDVVILNSDARVTPRWLEGLRRAASSDIKIGTVTPMSDRAGAFSAPDIGNENMLPQGVTEADYSIEFRRSSGGLYPVVPTGNGFCMYITRACLDEVGLFDAVAFPRGYGEENDFCMRAGRLGWKHIIDDKTYIFHERAKSFGATKNKLIVEGRRILNERYPEYSKAIRVFSCGPSIIYARFNAKLALSKCKASPEPLPRVLFVISTDTGGTPKTNLDLMKSLSESFEPWLFQCRLDEMKLYKVDYSGNKIEFQHHRLREKVDPITHCSFEYDRVINNWLTKYDFELIHIRHLAWHSLSLTRIAKELGLAVVKSFHDFYTICPTVNLLDENHAFCNGKCATKLGKCKHELWPDNSLPLIKSKWIHNWRAKFEETIMWCDAFVTTSRNSKKTVLSTYPQFNRKPFYVIPHGRDFSAFEQLSSMPQKDQPLDILVPGNINVKKGANVIIELLEMDDSQKLHFHILGRKFFSYSHPRLTYHGQYTRDNFNQYVRDIMPNIGAVFSIMDETWCHVLTELLAAGIPTIVLGFPTLTARVEESDAGWVFDHRDIGELYNSIIKHCYDEKEMTSKIDAVLQWQAGEGSFRTTGLMASCYESIYKEALRNNLNRRKIFISRDKSNLPSTSHEKLDNNIIAVVCPSSENLKSAPGSTHIRVWERTRNILNNKFTYCRMLPGQLLTGVRAGEIRAAIIQRNALPNQLWQKLLLPYIQKGYLKYIFDIDDDLLDVPFDKDPNGVYKEYGPTLEGLIKHASLVTVSTKKLRKKFQAINSNIKVIQNLLSRRLWAGTLEKQLDRNKFIALYFGTITHEKDLELIYPALESISKKYAGFKLKVIGIKKEFKECPRWLEVLSIPDKWRDYPKFVKWLKAEAENVDLGIAPLENNEFNKYKSNLKILEYAGLGLPVIASANEVFEQVSKEAPHVSIADSMEDWESKIIEFMNLDKGKILKKGEQMRQWVLENHLIDSKAGFDGVIADIL